VVGQSRPKCTTHPKNRSSRKRRSNVPPKTHIAKTPHFANRNTKGDKLNKAFPKTANAKRIYRSNKQRGPAAERGGSIELERRCAGRGVGIARTAVRSSAPRSWTKEGDQTSKGKYGGLVRAEEEGGMEGPTDVIVLRPRMRGPPETPTRWRRRGCGAWCAPAVSALCSALCRCVPVPAVGESILHPAPRHLFFSHHPSLALVVSPKVSIHGNLRPT
jgi:hypothetical protein